MTADEYDQLPFEDQSQILQTINDQRALKTAGSYMLGSPVSALTDTAFLPFDVVRNVAELGRTSRAGKALGLANPFENPDLIPLFSQSQQKSIDYRKGQQPIDYAQFNQALNVASKAPASSSQNVSTSSSSAQQPQSQLGGPVLNMPGSQMSQLQNIALNQSAPSGLNIPSNVLNQAGAPNAATNIAPIEPRSDEDINVRPATVAGAQYAAEVKSPKDSSEVRQALALNLIRSDKVGLSARGLNTSPDGAAADYLKLTSNMYDDDYMATLKTREEEAEKRLNKRLESMDELEKDFPTRDNIKKRLKEQTDLGVAAAFFKAAASDKPDFLAAISEGFAGATDVMSKMTAQEQKELYKHAMDTYTRESNKANTDYKRQQDLLKKIDTANTTRIALAKNRMDSQNQLNTLVNNDYWKRMTFGLDLDKASSEEYNRYMDVKTGINEKWVDTYTKLRESDIESKLKVSLRENRLLAAIDVGADTVGISSAVQLVNSSMDDILKDMDRVYKAEVEAGRADTALEQAYAQVQQNYKDDDKLGSAALLDTIGYDLSQTNNFNGTPQQFLDKYAQLRPWLRYKSFQSKITN